MTMIFVYRIKIIIHLLIDRIIHVSQMIEEWLNFMIK